MKYPSGFTPKEGSKEIGMYAEESKSVNFINLSGHKAEEANKDGHGNCVNKNSKEDESSLVCLDHFKKSGVPRTCGSILNLMDELVKVGQVMGYKMDGCMSNMTEITESQRVKEDYLTYEIGKWKGEVVIMGDFKEVRYKSDRFGSVFNVQGANVFNSFFTNAGLEERYLSDHRPILLREASFDYGPTPFRYFHYWNEMEGFNKVVEDAWREGPCDKTNAMINMSKSKILGVNVDSDKVKGAASKLGCLILKTPFTYLGSKVGGSMSRVHAWNEVIDRVKNRLSKWKMKNVVDWSSSGDFSVASVRKIIDDKSLSDVESKTRWIKYVPIKVNVHAWKVKTDSLPTRFNVSRRGIDIDSIMCAICDNGVETSRHLFFYCCMVRQIVRKITRWWDVPYVEVESYEDWYNWLVNLRISSMHKQMFEGIDVMRRLVGTIGLKTRILSLCNC
ncbi:RNA-directed DNA polymerase, eukaryota [Tanacetum coccineum]